VIEYANLFCTCGCSGFTFERLESGKLRSVRCLTVFDSEDDLWLDEDA
jgi:hypothetical protein